MGLVVQGLRAPDRNGAGGGGRAARPFLGVPASKAVSEHVHFDGFERSHVVDDVAVGQPVDARDPVVGLVIPDHFALVVQRQQQAVAGDEGLLRRIAVLGPGQHRPAHAQDGYPRLHALRLGHADIVVGHDIAVHRQRRGRVFEHAIPLQRVARAVEDGDADFVPSVRPHPQDRQDFPFTGDAIEIDAPGPLGVGEIQPRGDGAARIEGQHARQRHGGVGILLYRRRGRERQPAGGVLGRHPTGQRNQPGGKKHPGVKKWPGERRQPTGSRFHEAPAIH